MRVRIDEARRDDEPARVDGALGCQARGAGVADEDDAVAAYADVGDARRRAGAVEDGAAAEEEVDVLARRGVERWLSETAATANASWRKGRIVVTGVRQGEMSHNGPSRLVCHPRLVEISTARQKT